MPSILKEAIQATSEQIEAELSRALHHCYTLTSGCCVHLPTHTHPVHTTPTSYLNAATNSSPPGALLHIVDSPLPPPPETTILLMKQALVNARQYQAYIKTLMVSSAPNSTAPLACTLLLLPLSSFSSLPLLLPLPPPPPPSPGGHPHLC